MQTVTILSVGRLKDRFYEEAAAEYLKRLQAYAKVQITEIKAVDLYSDSPSDAEVSAALKKEGEELLRRIPENAEVVTLCVEGKLWSSEDMADCLTLSANAGKSQVVFVVGGSYGLSDAVKARADARVSMSRMTFPHRLARVMLLEQIYRGYKIAKGEKYHK